MTTDPDQLRRRLVQRVEQLDDEALAWLDDVLAEAGLYDTANVADDEPKLLTRRQLLAGALTGGLVLGGTNVATAWYARSVGEATGWEAGTNVGQARTLAEVSKTRQEMQAEIDALRGLVAHYEALESTDLDRAVSQSIEDFESSVTGLQNVTQRLVDGLDTVRNGLERFEESVPAIRQGMARVDDTLDALDQRLDGLRQVLADVIERTEPVAESVGAFFDALLDRVPFGLGDRIELVVLRLRQVIEGVPATVTAVRGDLLEPLRTTWFDDADADVQAGLLTPMRTKVLDPTEQLLADLDAVAETWQTEVAAPVQDVLAERHALRRSLADYKERHGLS